ncbi:MAG: hypothetical protein J6C26_08790 [Clostridia bacterium]|nr:hypothetical protein [Clostridia bacterium]
MKKGILFVVALIICVFIPTFFLAKASSGLYIASKECPQAYVDSAEHPMQLRMGNSSIVAEIDGKTYTLYTYPQNALPTSSIAARSAEQPQYLTLNVNRL